MFQGSTTRSRFGLASATLIALLVLSTGSVAADTTPAGGTFTQIGKSADAGSGECVSNGDGTSTCSSLGISVFVGRMSDNFSGVTHANQVCVYRERFTYSEDTGDLVGEPLSEFGCKIDLSSGTITFGRKLSTVTLAATTVTIEQMVCDDVSCEPGSSRDVTVVGTWTGVGATTSSKYRSSFDDGTCRYADSWKGSSRNASFVGTIDGVSLGAEGYAYIQEGKSTYRSRCSEI